MTENEFWGVIDLLDWNQTGDDDAVAEPLVARLGSLEVEDIEQFEQRLAEKLHALDLRAIARTWNDGDDEHFSGDLFLYARCCVVANGRDFFNKVLEDPNSMPRELEFEALLYLAGTAYERKTGRSFEFHATVSYETCWNHTERKSEDECH